MPRCPLLPAALCCLVFSAALAQSHPQSPPPNPLQNPPPGLPRAALPGYRAGGPARPLPLPPLPPGPAAVLPPAPIPTVAAAAACAPLVAPAQRFGQPLPLAALPEAPRRDQTGPRAAPPYDLYQAWPEAQRKYTLPAPWAPPLAVQVLQALLSQ